MALSEPGKHNAIHGLVRWVNWEAIEHTESHVVMEHTLTPQDGYPFSLALRIDYRLDANGLAVETTATNLGGSDCTYGAGAHPYLTIGTDSIDRCNHFRGSRAIGSTQLDTGYRELDRDPDGRARVSLQATGDDGRRVTLWLNDRYPYLMLFTGDSLPDRARRRRGLGSPMTCAPNAFRSGEGLHTLKPGGTFTSAWGIRPG